MQTAIQLFKSNPHAGVDSVMKSVLDGKPSMLLRYIDRESMSRTLYRVKKNLLKYPPGPTTPSSLVIPEERKLHTGGSQFVMFDDTLEGVRIIMMSSPQNMQILADAEVIAMDGIFEMRFPSKRKCQLYSIHAYVKRGFVVTVVVAMSRRTTHSPTSMSSTSYGSGFTKTTTSPGLLRLFSLTLRRQSSWHYGRFSHIRSRIRAATFTGPRHC